MPLAGSTHVAWVALEIPHLLRMAAKGVLWCFSRCCLRFSALCLANQESFSSVPLAQTASVSSPVGAP